MYNKIELKGYSQYRYINCLTATHHIKGDKRLLLVTSMVIITKAVDYQLLPRTR